MSIYSEWYDHNNNIILTTHGHDWTWDDLKWHDSQVLPEFVRDSTASVGVIRDMTRSDWLPESDEFIEHIKDAGNIQRTLDIDIVIFVINQEEIGSVLALAYREFAVQGCKYYFTDSVHDAYSVIMTHRG